jgi:hypothetical protein
MSPRQREALFLGALLAALALVQSVHLTRPFLRHHESVGTEISKHARNHLKFGLSKTVGLKLDVSDPSLDPYPDYKKYYYSNHPPLPALLMAGGHLKDRRGIQAVVVALDACEEEEPDYS